MGYNKGYRKDEPFDNDFEDDDIVYLPPLVPEDSTLAQDSGKDSEKKTARQEELDDILKEYLDVEAKK
jgi:hypothetical protein